MTYTCPNDGEKLRPSKDPGLKGRYECLRCRYVLVVETETEPGDKLTDQNLKFRG